jgi:hypothetical protein
MRNFPICVSGICKTLHDWLVIRAHEICALLDIHSDGTFIEAKELIRDGLLEEFAGIDAVMQSIYSIKIDQTGDRRQQKDSLKKDSIRKILVPIIWGNLVEDFTINPSGFVRF